MAFLLALMLMTGIFIGVTGYKMYLRRLYRMEHYIKAVQHGGKAKRK
jgi:hypothetical protein